MGKMVYLLGHKARETRVAHGKHENRFLCLRVTYKKIIIKKALSLQFMRFTRNVKQICLSVVFVFVLC